MIIHPAILKIKNVLQAFTGKATPEADRPLPGSSIRAEEHDSLVDPSDYSSGENSLRWDRYGNPYIDDEMSL